MPRPVRPLGCPGRIVYIASIQMRNNTERPFSAPLNAGRFLPPCHRYVLSAPVSQVGIQELTGHNDGKEVEIYLHSVGLKKGAPYCSAFVCWLYIQSCLDNPKDGLASAWFTKNIVYD